jgi:predicted PurR-regulated permease PerM
MGRLTDAWLNIPKQRRRRLVLLLLALLVVSAICWAARAVLAPYFLGLGLAYILSPLVYWLERGLSRVGRQRKLVFFRRIARPLAIILTYLLVIAAVVGFFSLVVPVVIEQAKGLWGEREIVGDYLSGLAEDLLEQYRLLPPQIQTQVERTLSKFSETVGGIVQQALGGTAIVFSYTISLVLAILIIPFWTFYLLKDSQELGRATLRSIPVQFRKDVLNIVILADSVFSSYLRGQLLLGTIIGLLSMFGYSLLGVRFAVLLGLIAGVFELLPNIGPILGGIPAVLVALTQGPVLALWTALLAFGIQQVENLFLTPRVLGRSVKLHPVLIMIVLVIGSEIGGVLGLFLAPVTTAVLRDIFRYLYYRLEESPLAPDAALHKVWEGEPFNMVL